MRTVADGQVANSATAIFTGVNPNGTVTVSLLNTSGASTETVLLTVIRNGQSTARRVARAVLAPNEQCLVSGLPLCTGDVLRAQTTDASVVDYIVSEAASDMPFGIECFDANGNLKNLAPTTVASIATTGRMQATLLAEGPAATDTYGAAMTIDVTKSLHIISASNTTSATCTMTPSAAGSAGDRLTIITETDGTGTVTTTYASTFHSSGTQATTASKFSSIEFESDGTRWIEKSRTTALT